MNKSDVNWIKVEIDEDPDWQEFQADLGTDGSVSVWESDGFHAAHAHFFCCEYVRNQTVLKGAKTMDEAKQLALDWALKENG